jgi:hypothetical protein
MRATELVGSTSSMAEGDRVEFQSDIQTDKGPATGIVLVRDGNQVAIKYSEGVEWFEAPNLNVLELTTDAEGNKLWLLA